MMVTTARTPAADRATAEILERVGRAVRADVRLDPVDSLQRFVGVDPETPAARYHGGARTRPVRGIVLHATAGDTADGAMGWMNRTLGRAEGKGSYQYLIDRDVAPGGSMRIVRFLDVGVVAYHAGASSWPAALGGGAAVPGWLGSLNSTTLGIAWANDNGSDGNLADDPLTHFQLCAGLWLCAVMCERFKLDPLRQIASHREVAPGRKTDPLPRVVDMDGFRGAVAAVLARRAHRARLRAA